MSLSKPDTSSSQATSSSGNSSAQQQANTRKRSSIFTNVLQDPNAPTSLASTPKKRGTTSQNAQAQPINAVDDDVDYKIHSDNLKASTTERKQLIVLCPPPYRIPRNIRLHNVQVLCDYEYTLPDRCITAKKADVEGDSQSPPEFRLAAIPQNKFGDAQYLSQDMSGTWCVQAVFKIPHSNMYWVCYEGYRFIFEQIGDEIEKFAPEAVEMFHQWDGYMGALCLTGSTGSKLAARMQKELITKDGDTLATTVHAQFWMLQDLSYFHTILQREHGLAAVFYVDLTEAFDPPIFDYTATNITKLVTLKHMMQQNYNKNIQQLLDSNAKKGAQTLSGCEKAEKCRCDEVYRLLYGPSLAHNLKPDQSGYLDISEIESLSEKRVVVECTNSCGCSPKCPRRRLQQGQRKPLAVTNEGERGFGLRAMDNYLPGEFVCEYAGTYYRKPSDTVDSEDERTDDISTDEKDKSYEVEFDVIDKQIVICALDAGSVGRFMNHSCDPNVILVETHSRVNDKDVMAPKLSAYAWKPISKGEPLYISYYGDASRVVIEEPGIECKCNSANCFGFLPIKWHTD